MGKLAKDIFYKLYIIKKLVNNINARIKEGYTVEDFKTVIDKKCAEWLGSSFEQYLCPETLFGTKFEKYLNANIIKKEEPSKFDDFESSLEKSFDFNDLERMTRG